MLESSFTKLVSPKQEQIPAGWLFCGPAIGWSGLMLQGGTWILLKV